MTTKLDPSKSGIRTTEFWLNAVVAALAPVAMQLIASVGGAHPSPTWDAVQPIASALSVAVYTYSRNSLKKRALEQLQTALEQPVSELSVTSAPASDPVSAPVTTVTGAGPSYTVTGPHGFGTSSPTEVVGVAEEVEPVVEPPVTVIEPDPVDGPPGA